MNESRMVYRVVATREDDVWLAEVPEVPGAHTFGRNLPSLDGRVRQVIALAEDLPAGAEDTFDLVWEYQTGDPVLDTSASNVRAKRREVERMSAEVLEETRALSGQLQRRGWTVRDIGRVLGIAPQRVAQLVPRDTASALLAAAEAPAQQSRPKSAPATVTPAVSVHGRISRKRSTPTPK